MVLSIKKAVCFVLVAFVYISASAQVKEEKKYLLNSKVQTYGFSSISLNDPYLSPLSYSGYGLRFNSLSRRFLSTESAKLSRQKAFNIISAMTFNPSNTASEIYVAADWGYGIHYHYRPLKNLQFMAGGVWDMDFGVKTITRNVNNPVNIDFSTNLNFSEIIQYDIPLKSRTLKLELAFQSPVLGFMFVPHRDASYYEMFSVGNLKGATHFSSLHNKLGTRAAVAINVPFNRSVWRFGVNYRYLKYKANEMLFKQNEFTVCIGSTFDAIHFGGRKNQAPTNFMSTNE